MAQGRPWISPLAVLFLSIEVEALSMLIAVFGPQADLFVDILFHLLALCLDLLEHLATFHR